jgi:hypothetical protein
MAIWLHDAAWVRFCINLMRHSSSSLSEGLGDVIVYADVEARELVGLHRLGGGENDGDKLVDIADILCYGEAVYPWQHDVEDAEIVAVAGEGLQSALAVAA